MTYIFPIRSYMKFVDALKGISSHEGSLKTIDTQNEREESLALAYELLSGLTKNSPDWTEKDFFLFKTPHMIAHEVLKEHLEKVIDQLRKGATLFIHPFFEDTIKENHPIATEMQSPKTVAKFIVFSGSDYNGGIATTVTIDEKEWEDITSPFSKPLQSPSEERIAVSTAVAIFERIVGPKVGTTHDIGGYLGNRIVLKTRPIQYIEPRVARIAYMNDPGPTIEPIKSQQDCINELQTTRQLLSALINDNRITHHRISDKLASAKSASSPREHYATMLIDISTNKNWVVDSWIRDNGEPAEVTLFSKWHKKHSK